MGGGGGSPDVPSVPEYTPTPPPTQQQVEAESAAIREDESRRQKMRKGVSANILAGNSGNNNDSAGIGQTLLGRT